MMYAKDHEKKKGNAKFQGFLIEMIEAIAMKFREEEIPFNYELYEVPDKNFGSKNEKGEWNGMINQLIQGVSLE